MQLSCVSENWGVVRRSLCFEFTFILTFQTFCLIFIAVLAVAYYLAKWLGHHRANMLLLMYISIKTAIDCEGNSWKQHILHPYFFLGLVPGFMDLVSVALILPMKFKQEEIKVLKRLFTACPVLLVWTLLLLRSCTFLVYYLSTGNASFIVGELSHGC